MGRNRRGAFPDGHANMMLATSVLIGTVVVLVVVVVWFLRDARQRAEAEDLT